MDGRTDNVKTVYPLQTKFAGGIIKGCWIVRFIFIQILILKVCSVIKQGCT